MIKTPFKYLLPIVLAGLLTGCVDDSEEPSISPDPEPLPVKEASLVTAAAYSGLYAINGRPDSSIEIQDIHQNVLATVAEDDLYALLPDDMNRASARIANMAFSASGRLFFISVRSEGKTAIFRYNTGIRQLSLFIAGLEDSIADYSGELGLLHHKGELWVGLADGQLLRYQALLDDSSGEFLSEHQLTVEEGSPAVIDITTDRYDNTAYISTAGEVYKLSIDTRAISPVLSQPGIKGISYGRTYGGPGQGGLYLLTENSEGKNQLYTVPTSELRGGSYSPAHYADIDWADDIALTADGGMMLSGDEVRTMRDESDDRLSYDDWVRDEYQQYVTYFKSTLWPEGTREGWVLPDTPSIAGGKNRYGTANPGGAGWAVMVLIAHEAMTGEETEGDVETILLRHAGMHADGVVPDTTSDGFVFSKYDVDTGVGFAHGQDPTASVYTTGKLMHAALLAKEAYPENSNIVNAANAILAIQRNYADYLRRYGKVEQRVLEVGPDGGDALAGNQPYQETYLLAELAPLVDPLAFHTYEDWWKYRENHAYLTNMLTDEPVVKWNISSFVEQYGHIVFRNYRQSPGWRENFQNLYAHYAGWTDDNNPHYLTVFSAGGTETAGYNADKINNHPDTITHFPGVLGFGLYGSSVPVVGVYYAYRDGRRQKLLGKEGVTGPDGTEGADMLTRYSNENPEWQLNRLAIPDMVFGYFGLAEQLQNLNGGRGVIDSAIARDASLEDFPEKPAHGYEASVFESEGELYLDEDFLGGISSWQQSGDFQFGVNSDPEIAISGASAEIINHAGVTSEYGRLTYTVDVSELPAMTPFVLRAQGRIYGDGAEDEAYLKLQWDTDADPGNSNDIPAEFSNVLDSSDYLNAGDISADKDFDLTTRKPVGANFAHISLEVRRNTSVAPKEIRYLFDNVTLRQLSIELSASTGWLEMNDEAKQTTVEIDGDNIEFYMPSGTRKRDQIEVYRDYPLDPADEPGTRYIVSALADTSNLDDSELMVYTQVLDNNEVIREEGGDVIRDLEDVTGREIYYSGRRLESSEDTLRVFFRFSRNASVAEGDQSAEVRQVLVTRQDPGLYKKQ